VTAAVACGGGHHEYALSQKQVQLASVLTLVGLTMGAISFTLTKVAVVILLIKLLHPSRWHVWFLWAMVGGNVLFIAVGGLVFFLQCKPPQALWVDGIEHTCWDPAVATGVATGASGKIRSRHFCFAFKLTCVVLFRIALSALSDFYLALYPAVVLWSIKMNWRKKLALSVALGFGALYVGLNYFWKGC